MWAQTHLSEPQSDTIMSHKVRVGQVFSSVGGLSRRNETLLLLLLTPPSLITASCSIYLTVFSQVQANPPIGPH